jgi:hypothetical protein
MGPIFDANEKFKEEIVLRFFANKAKTTLHKNGSYYLSDPFLETEITWKSKKDFQKISLDLAEELGDSLRKLQADVSELGGQMTPPMFEFREGIPLLVWAQFFTSEPKEIS